jgi:hypothetical protein
MATITSPSTDALLRERALGQVARLLADRVGADAAMVSVLTDDGRLDHVRAGTGIEAVLRNDARFVRRAIRSDRTLVKRVPPQDGPGGLACIVAAPIQVPSMVAGAVTAGFSEPPEAPVDSLTWMLEAHAALAGLCLGDPDGVRRLLTAAEWIPGWSPDDLLQNAASALITAKRPAGNRIVAAPTPRQSRRSSRRPARP